MEKDKLLKSFFYGTLLGDSYIHNGVFYCKQISEDLIKFKGTFIKRYLPSARISIKSYEEYTDKNGVHHQKYYVLSVNDSYIKELDKTFYKNGIKVYPSHAILELDPLGFAMWYADDGTTVIVQNGKNRRVQICTDNFTQVEHQEIKKDLESLGYKVKLIDRKRGGQLRTQLNDGKLQQKFLLTIWGYFYKYFPSLLYKMDLGYRNKQLDKRKYVTEKYKKIFEIVSAHPEFIDRIALKTQDDIVQTTNRDNNDVSES